MKFLAAGLLLLCTLGVTHKLHDYHMTIVKSMAACHGALGSVHFENGQAMVFASPGVNESLHTGSELDAQGMVFTNARTRARAAFEVYPKRRLLEANHITFKIPGKFACILPD